MSTLANLNANLLTLVTSPLNATGLTWTQQAEALTRDHTVDGGEVVVQISSGIVLEDGDSNSNYTSVQALIELHYNASDSSSLQTAWLEVHLQSVLSALIVKTAWRSMSSVHEVLGTPEVSFPSKVGNVISVSVSALVKLN